MNIGIIDDIYEDSQVIALYLNDYLEKHNIDMAIHIYSYQKELDFFNDFHKYQFDLIFIDYFLEQMTGFELAKQIRREDVFVSLIFITCSRDYAIETYKVKASGYLVKPLHFAEFEEMMSLLDNRKMRDSQFIEIVHNYQTERIRIKDIIACEIDGHYVQLRLRNEEVKKTRNSMANFVKMLKPYREFLHCHRGCMINLSYVKEVTELAFVMYNGIYIPYRRKQKAKMLKYYADYLFQNNREFG